MIKVDEEAIPDERIPRTVPPRERNAFSTGSKTDGGSPLRSDVAFSITKGPLMILEGERGTKKKEKKKKKKKKKKRERGNGLGSEIFLGEREREREQVPPKPSSFDILLHLSPVATVAQVPPRKFTSSSPRIGFAD